MEIGQLYQGLTFLAYTTGIIVILVGIMLVKVLFDLSKLTNNINNTANIVKEELIPTLKNVNKSVEIVSGVIIKADESVNKVKEFIANSPLKILFHHLKYYQNFQLSEVRLQKDFSEDFVPA